MVFPMNFIQLVPELVGAFFVSEQKDSKGVCHTVQ